MSMCATSHSVASRVCVWHIRVCIALVSLSAHSFNRTSTSLPSASFTSRKVELTQSGRTAIKRAPIKRHNATCRVLCPSSFAYSLSCEPCGPACFRSCAMLSFACHAEPRLRKLQSTYGCQRFHWPHDVRCVACMGVRLLCVHRDFFITCTPRHTRGLFHQCIAYSFLSYFMCDLLPTCRA